MADERHQGIVDLLTQEAALVDEKRWDEWLELFTEDVQYWIPAWDSEHELTRDPLREISLMYYTSRAGLEDRVYRLRTERSSASLPLPRTCHMVSNVRTCFPEAEVCDAQANWAAYSFRFKESHCFFGHYAYRLRAINGHWRIHKKTITVLNDVIPTVLDIYSV